MDILRKIWPLSFRYESKGPVKPFVITLVIYVVASLVIGIISGILSFVPVLGTILNIVNYVCDIYITAGIVFAILSFIGVGPFKTTK